MRGYAFLSNLFFRIMLSFSFLWLWLVQKQAQCTICVAWSRVKPDELILKCLWRPVTVMAAMLIVRHQHPYVP